MREVEVIQVVRLISSVLSKVLHVIDTDATLRGSLKRGLEYIKREMMMVIREVQVNEESKQAATHETKILLLKELACDIEDFVDGAWVPRASSGLILSVIGMDPRPQLLDTIDDFKKRIESVRNWQPSAAASSHVAAAAAAATLSSCPSSSPCGGCGYDEPPPPPCTRQSSQLVGVAKPIDELLELLSAAEGEGQPQELKVISIVGRRGVGKTALARAVYDHALASRAFERVAWVVASVCKSSDDLLNKILRAIVAPTSESGSTNIHGILHSERYLVIIDDMNEAEVWQGVKYLFPENGRSSRIIVTTSVNSVAAECSLGSYVYRMQGMGKDDSTKLLWEKVGAESQSRVLARASEGILKKCDGLPLALISVANYLRRQGRASRYLTGGLTSEHCIHADRAFGDNVLGGREAEFVKIMTTLTDWYDDLPDFVHQSCLLYFSVFPRHRAISCKALIRRWIAEGLVVADGTLSDEEVAPGCLDKLVDRNIIELVMTRGAEAASCRVHSVMLEFIIQKSVSKNFTALVRNGECLRNKDHICRVRRLSVQYTSTRCEVVDELAAKDAQLSAIRSLTIIRSYLVLFDLQKCKFLRVLDLDSCYGVDKEVVSAICKLLFLKYLSLRRTDIDNLPSELEKLRNLESLDIRQTRLTVLPREAIKLPQLAHVFGQFRLASGITEKAMKGCRLQTLAGAVVLVGDKNISFQQIILHARRLRKVKIYENTSYGSSSVRTGTSNKRAKRSCFDSQESTYPSPLLLSLKKRFTGSNPIQAVSIDSKYTICQEFLSILEAPCAITSVKLRGKLYSLPASPTLSQLDNLNKLKLFSTGQSSEDLSALQSLPSLEYLKLFEERDGFWTGSFIVQSGGFPSLKRLCFEAPKLPEVQFRRGSMRFLAILDLLCPDPRPPPSLYFSRSFQTQGEGQIGGEGISHLENLNEVVLHYSVSDIKIQAWKKEAVGHKNRPLVNRQPMPLPAPA